jgi:hypothetical protein
MFKITVCHSEPVEVPALEPGSATQTASSAASLLHTAGAFSPVPVFHPIEPRVPIDKSRRTLPHWEQGGCTYFITYRLADAMPAAKLREWRWQLDLWLEHHPKPWYEKEWHEYRTRFEGPIQQWLDAGHGSCALKNPVVREIVVEAFHHHDGTRYHLGDYVINSTFTSGISARTRRKRRCRQPCVHIGRGRVSAAEASRITVCCG